MATVFEHVQRGIFNEFSLSRVYTHTQERNIGMLTAHRGEFTAEENNERNKSLEHDIRKSGYGFVHVKGRYIENYGTDKARPVDEHSYLVIGKKGDDKGSLKNFLTNAGQKYGQDSVLHKSYNNDHASLLGTKEGGFPGMGKTHDVGTWHPMRAGEFHSIMKRGGQQGDTTFTFESISFLTQRGFFVREDTEF